MMVVRLVLIPSAFDIEELQPVARIAMPYSVPKNQYSAAMISTTNSSAVPTVRIISTTSLPAVTYLDEMTSGNLSTDRRVSLSVDVEVNGIQCELSQDARKYARNTEHGIEQRGAQTRSAAR